MSLLRLTAVASAILAAACALAVPHARAATCGEGTYAYAGLGAKAPASGVSATIVPTAVPTVRDGHVDGWIGVGGPGLGPKGTDEWIQVGLTAVPGAQNVVYYEIVRPGYGDLTKELRRNISVGSKHTFAVREVAGKPNWWRVWLDGSPASAPVLLPSSHGRWAPQAVGESWAGTTSGTCNVYAYSFSNVRFSSALTGAWSPFVRVQPFQDPNYRLVRSSASSFVARSAPAARTAAKAP